jgi:rhodanese-related sulfurtransferase
VTSTVTPADAATNPASNPERVTAAELHDRPGIAVLDVRTPGEFETAHIPGSVNVPLDQLDRHAERLASADIQIAVVCQSGGRAEKAHQQLKGAGATRTAVLTGGMGAWAESGGPTEDGRPRWAMDRQVRLAAGSLVLAGILTSLRWPKARFLSGAIGGGLVFSAVSNTCGMAAVLAKLPYNRSSEEATDRAVSSLLG